ncbi:MAG: hypothetical protein LBK62_04290 [Treponema sp.]|jgi:hypothetical protein|nr:hypothetical protein [Treponema sp.]
MMNKEELVPWINRLNAEPDGKKRNEIVAELCKEKSLKIGDAWKFLKEAGFDSKAIPRNPGGAGTNNGDTNPQSNAAETRPAVLRHKTPYQKYRCAGLVLTQKAETCRVTEAQLEKLRRDPWVVIIGEPEQK